MSDSLGANDFYVSGPRESEYRHPDENEVPECRVGLSCHVRTLIKCAACTKPICIDHMHTEYKGMAIEPQCPACFGWLADDHQDNLEIEKKECSMNRQGIEGIPAWVKVVGIKPVTKNEWFIGPGTILYQWTSEEPGEYSLTIVAPDNVYDRVDLENYPIREDHERVEVEWFRTPLLEEYYVTKSGSIQRYYLPDVPCSDTRRIIVRPIKRTVKVLVAEWDNPEHSHPYSIVPLGVKPDRFRIEEREI